MPLKPKKVPMRMCVGCREMKPKRELIRIVRSPEGVISIDRKGKAPGRGAYCCDDPACMAKLMKGNLLSKAFETGVDKAVYEQLMRQLSAPGGEDAGQ